MTCVSFTLLTGLLPNGIACPIGRKQPITLRYFFKRLDQYWQHQDIIFDFRAQIEGTGSRSEVSRVNIV